MIKACNQCCFTAARVSSGLCLPPHLVPSASLASSPSTCHFPELLVAFLLLFTDPSKGTACVLETKITFAKGGILNWDAVFDPHYFV